ncbi:hypothetical protein ANN_23398 [Periplaneta americana]|uniref:MULE transposase domain-containing protein n=1 Tax=Periplaneta americana TaxID=6978 RepID=A0ABQ8SMF3_PERAM|nr:hypothetical protein ANN_23398 [Periplaneta americana]
MDKLARKYLGDDIPSITELKKNTSLIMANSHFSLNTPRPTIPAFVEVGGLHLKTDGKLPKDLKTYLDNSKEGVIYFCLGSLIKSSTLPEDKKQMFIEAFSNTKLNVLWKIDEISGLPDNVKTYKWFPQFEILKHPNVRMFITHGGLMGTMEGVYTGVPMIGVPMFADQELNINVCVMKGIAILLDFDTLTTEKITNAIDAILNNLRVSFAYPLEYDEKAKIGGQEILRKKRSGYNLRHDQCFNAHLSGFRSTVLRGVKRRAQERVNGPAMVINREALEELAAASEEVQMSLSERNSVLRTINRFQNKNGPIVPVPLQKLSRKEQITYTPIFEEVKMHAQRRNLQLQPDNAMTDLEMAAINAIRTGFPPTRVQYCLFYFTQAIWRFGVTQSQLKVP